MSKALCASNPEAWFPEMSRGRRVSDPARVCLACPLLAECNALAEQMLPTAGIWAARLWKPVYSGSQVGRPVMVDTTDPKRCVTPDCENRPQSRRRGLCWTCIKRAQKEAA